MSRRLHFHSTRLVLLAALVTLCVVLSSPAWSGSKKQILLLNSYHHNFQWSEDILRGLTDVLRPRETGMLLHIENMDTKRVEFNTHYAQQLLEVFRHKYQDIDLDLIFATDDNAFLFLKKYHEILFPDIPVVFCGVNSFSAESMLDFPSFTGVSESINAKDTLWWALKLHPHTKSIYIINDDTPSGRSITQAIKSQLKTFSPHIKITYAENQNFSEILANVQSMPRNGLILQGIFNRDRDGQFYDLSETTEILSEKSNVPVYGLFDFDLGHGIVGGLLTRGYDQGQAMAQMALHVLAGRNPQNIPVLHHTAYNPMFDYTQMKRFGVNLEELPDGSDVINRPSSFYSAHADFIWLGSGLAIAQSVIILLLIVNISRRRRAEKDLRQIQRSLEERVRQRTTTMMNSEKALRTVFDSAQDAIFIHDKGGRIIEANNRTLEMYGFKGQDPQNISIARDMSSRDNPIYRLSSIWKNALSGQPQNFEWRAKRISDEHEFDVEVSLNHILFRDQDAILANVRDISIRKESENSIRQSLFKFEAIFENSLVGISMSSKEALAAINQRGAEIFGYTQGEILTMDLVCLFENQEEKDAFLVQAKEALHHNGVFNTERAFINKSGVPVWCRMYAKAVDPHQLDKGIIWAWDDITLNRSTREDLMRAREDAEAANRAKSEFLAAMSHEIRTPMNAIVGMTDITLQTDLNEEQRDYLKTVQDSAQHLLSIINDILDLSKIEAQKLELDHVDFDLIFHVRTTIKGLEIQARQKGLDLILQVDESVRTCVKGDPLSLRQVLVNLVGNAIKFTHRGAITIRVLPAKTPPAQDSPDLTEGIAFEVEDTGIGIPQEFMDSVFQSFSQTTRAFGGTGLGLAICNRLISLMGGEIHVQSTVGQGSIFSFTVWFEQGESCSIPPVNKRSVPEAPQRPIRILVAEDNDVNVMVTTLKLEDLGYSYQVAGTGLAVLDLLKREPFDLILMDIEMPVLDGISTTKTIRSAVPGGPIPNPDIPIIGVTAHALKEFRDKSLDAGMNDYISKPVDFLELATIINRLIGTAPPVPPQKTEKIEKTISPRPNTPGETWTPDAAMDYLGVDKATFEDFLFAARTELNTRTEELKQTLDAQDPSNAHALAHTIKSICMSIGADAAAQAAASLETACREKTNTPEQLIAFQKEMTLLVQIMDTHL
ncbi:PAS domain S-box protein [Pseudodesulfovibrio sp. JC047]|uniref:ABC transporter substrate binding protein n=1 Tax=Pseudodesulfovibrio sp. JC047 TaxID=2683199 RepID=UPI0013D06F71|nr:ABC transporter substrate binding protein [Pseudodesulfovibrio sp. JC047]NDV20500.1 PAS domain S-box protein [Pseudodesulfovibrio sp. JC047]